MKLTTHLHLVLRLRVDRAVPLFPLHALTAWTGTSLLYASNLKMRNDKIAKVKKPSVPHGKTIYR